MYATLLRIMYYDATLDFLLLVVFLTAKGPMTASSTTSVYQYTLVFFEKRSFGELNLLDAFLPLLAMLMLLLPGSGKHCTHQVETSLLK
jgi:hypothetical protein